MEEWKSIDELDNKYEISSLGNVRNVNTGKILTGDINNIGYRRITYNKKHYFIHRLVAKYFVEGYEEGLVVNHKDGNKLNNTKDNLEWVTRSENDLHAFRLHLRKTYPCTHKHKVIRFDLDTNEILQVYENTTQCSEDLNVARSNVYNTCNGKQKSCKGFGLKYA